MSERILCAAIHVDDGEEYEHQPTETGLVFCGHRHHAIIELVYVAGYRDRRKHVQGFLTSRNRFVSRVEAMSIALAANQTLSRRAELYSEDLY